jgi:hypothetical protein
MNDQMNTPMVPPPGGVSDWVSVWRDALTKPSEQTFFSLAQSPNAKLTTALIWVFLGSLVNILFASLVQGAIFRQMMRNTNFGQNALPRSGVSILASVCAGPIVSVIGFVIFVGIVQLLARMFGGRGTFEQLAYAIAAIVTPFSLINSVFTLLAAIPFVGLCFGFISLLGVLYVIALEVMAVKGVNQLGWGQALGSYFLPGIVLCCCLSVGVFAIARAIGTQFPDLFNSFPTPVP